MITKVTPDPRRLARVPRKGVGGSKAARQVRILISLRNAGHPVLSFEIPDEYGLGGEFFRWEFATAVCGFTLGINPFDQPDVEIAKIKTKTILKEMEDKGAARSSDAVFDGRRFKISFGPETLKKPTATRRNSRGF